MKEFSLSCIGSYLFLKKDVFGLQTSHSKCKQVNHAKEKERETCTHPCTSEKERGHSLVTDTKASSDKQGWDIYQINDKHLWKWFGKSNETENDSGRFRYMGLEQSQSQLDALCTLCPDWPVCNGSLSDRCRRYKLISSLCSDSPLPTTECLQATPSVGSSLSWDGPVYSAATFPATVWSQFKLDLKKRERQQTE